MARKWSIDILFYWTDIFIFERRSIFQDHIETTQKSMQTPFMATNSNTILYIEVDHSI